MSLIKKKLKKNIIIKKIILIRDKGRCQIEYIRSRKYIKKNKIRALYQSKEGKRCFVVGNGPSLTLEDLDRLVKEDTFASNSIYKLFDKTNWRPTYYVSQDVKVLDDLSDDLRFISSECKYVFLNSYICDKYGDVYKENNVYPFYVDTFDDDIHYPNFSDDIVKCLSEGYTVTYACIQMAVYMGYSEIFILGCDHNYNATYTIDGQIKTEEKINNYMKLMEHKLINLPRLDKTTIAYQKARIECEKIGVKIFNATRGGKLEVFDRKCFDELF